MVYIGPTSKSSIKRCKIPPEDASGPNRFSPCSSVSVPWNVIFSPAINEPVISNISITVGAKITNLVNDSSPRSPVEPLIPSKDTVIVIGPGVVNGFIEIIDADSPLESVNPDSIITSSILTSYGTAITAEPALSIIEILIEIESPLIVLLSGSRSSGLRIDSNEYPLLSKIELFVLSP